MQITPPSGPAPADLSAAQRLAYTPSRQAQGTQAWQADYFLDLSDGSAVNLARVQSLFQSQNGSSRPQILREQLLKQ